ncbi:hypothetical protein TEU_06025 [Thermococcus eurythermalis]|uniref:Uncharacterized protein n=1 Tax=Thermococcus eurythermalis TaxID=1505907 RepID=A0A097QTV7_9EURY|nr:hypothetical protein TEU_06025 [Thermococcus eurythermalis]
MSSGEIETATKPKCLKSFLMVNPKFLSTSGEYPGFNCTTNGTYFAPMAFAYTISEITDLGITVDVFLLTGIFSESDLILSFRVWGNPMAEAPGYATGTTASSITTTIKRLNAFLFIQTPPLGYIIILYWVPGYKYFDPDAQKKHLKDNTGYESTCVKYRFNC